MLGDDEKIGQNEMPYPTDVHGPATINYDTAGPRIDGPSMLKLGHERRRSGDPADPGLPGRPDPGVHAISAPANEQPHSFSLGGLDWSADPGIPESDAVETLGVVPQGVVDAHVTAGSIGDYYGDLRRPFTVAGMWGLQRVLDPVGCPMIGVDGHVCGAALPAPTVTMTAAAVGGLVSGTRSRSRRTRPTRAASRACSSSSTATSIGSAADVPGSSRRLEQRDGLRTGRATS